jgi:parallel beta helix pectate lyase-like protein
MTQTEGNGVLPKARPFDLAHSRHHTIGAARGRAMLKHLSPLLLAIALGPWLQLVPAHAQAARTFVSGKGRDGYPCTASSPCRTLAAALARTNAGGEIYVLDSANYGSATITQAVTIVAEDGVAGVLASGSVTGITINAGADDVVTLRGLDIDGAGSGANGILFTTGGTLNVQNCVIRRFTNSGIGFQPAGPSSLFVADTTVSDNAGAAIQFRNGAAAMSIAVLKDVQLINNQTGLAAQGSASTGPANVTVENSVIANNRGAGIVSAGFSVVSVANSTIVNNAVGLSAEGAGAVVSAAQSTVTANATGLQAANGGQVVSSANNAVGGNAGGNTVPSTVEPPPPPPPPPSASYVLDSDGGYVLDANGGRMVAL